MAQLVRIMDYASTCGCDRYSLQGAVVASDSESIWEINIIWKSCHTVEALRPTQLEFVVSKSC